MTRTRHDKHTGRVRLHLFSGMALSGMLFITAQAHAADLPVPVRANDPNFRWDGARAPVIDGRQMRIDQTARNAVLHWRSFDIARGNSVKFVQPSASSVALNRIFQNDPSRIFGKLEANGQVFLINQNGFLFGSQSSVDVNTLIASTLDIDDRIFEDVGLLGAIDQPGSPAAFTGNGDMGAIEIAGGANLRTQEGGRIMILAPKIDNKGRIETPGGQTVLAASRDKVYLASSSDPDLRGLLVEVETGGDVNNLGEIVARRGNISLLGLAVNQQGLVRATTSATLNGSIRLAARDRVVISGGTVKHPEASRTGSLTVGGRVEVLLDSDSAGQKAPDSQLQPHSDIQLMGGRISLEGDARITAPSGNVAIQAVSDPRSVTTLQRAPDDKVSLRIANGAVIDVSGTRDTVLSVADNIIAVEARGGELADSPKQRNGALRSKTLRVDVRKGTPLLDISSAVANIQRSTRERLSTGGQVTLLSDGELVAGAGSVIDIRGGQVTYTGDRVSTSRLVTDDFEVVDISQADPNRRYQGVLGDIEVRHEKWGILETFRSDAFSRFETGYSEGRDAGGLTINSPHLAFNGEIRAGSAAGSHQRQAPRTLTDGGPRPFDQRPFGGSVDVLLRTNETGSLPSLIVTGDERLTPAPATSETVDPLSPATLSAAMLNRSGLGRIGLEAPGDVRIDRRGALTLGPDTVLALDAGRIVFNDDVRMPGGRIIATASDAFAVAAEDVAIDVAPDVTLDVSGLWANDNPLLAGVDEPAPVVLNGGSIELNAGGDLRLALGSQLRADAGAWREADGVTHGGDGGEITLVAAASNGVLPTELRLDGDFNARGFTKNGTFSLTANGFYLDDGEIAPGVSLAFDGFSQYRFSATRDGVVMAPGARLTLRQRNLQLNAQATVQRSGEVLPADVVVLPDWARRPVDLALDSSGLPDLSRAPLVDIGTGARIIADPGASITLRSATSLKVDGGLRANGGEITLAIDSSDAGYRADQKIWLGDHARLDVSGRFIAHPGNPDLRAGQVLDAGRVVLDAARGSLVTRAGSLIDVHGVAATLDLPTAPAKRFGSQRFEATRVSGRAGEVDLRVAETALLQGRYDARVASAHAEGGRFSLRLDTSGRGQPTLDEEASLPVGQRFPHGPRTLRLAEYAGRLPDADAPVAAAENGQAYVPAEHLLDSGFTSLYLSSRPDQKSGKLQTLESVASIRFDRDMTLNAGRALILDAPLYENTGVDVHLSAPYVALGNRFDIPVDGAIPQSAIDDRTNRAITLAPSVGEGLLTVSAGQVDLVGHSVWQGFGTGGERLGLDIASRGDIRLRGELMRSTTGQRLGGLTGGLRTAGDVRLSARQVYPSTLTRFDMRVEGPGEGLIRVERMPGTPGQALSAGGRLSFSAARIEQAGVVRAPFGEISLAASQGIEVSPGSLTSVSGAGLTVPYGQLEFQTDLTFPLGDIAALPDAPPTRLIRLAAPSVSLSRGAKLDVSGGGEARAWEFVPGPGGSRDILDAAQAGQSFTILPALGSAFAPWDPLASPRAEAIQGLRVGDTLQLEGGAGLAAGEYAILPARYALYGGYLVTPVAGSQDLVPGSFSRRADGAPILAGRRGVAGSGFYESRTQGYAIEDGGRVRLRAEYVEKNLDTLFPDALTGVADAGRLSIEAGRALSLGASLSPNRAGGRGAQVDISADALHVVQQASQTSQTGIELSADALSALGAESLLLGGLRDDTGGLTRVTATAQQLLVKDGVDLALPELILVAHDLQVGEGGPVTLRSAGPALPAGADLDLRGDAALLAVSSRRGLQLHRSETPAAPTARLRVRQGAALSARDGGMILDSPSELSLAGTVTGFNGSIQYGGERVSLGETDGLGLDGLVLNNRALAGLQGTDLILRSSRQIDIYGVLEDEAGKPVNFDAIRFDAPGLVGHALDGRQLVLSGGQVELSNFSSRQATRGAPAGGDFLLQADTLSLDGGKGDAGFTLAGFDAQRIVVRDGVHVRGGGRLVVDGDLTLETPYLTAAGGAEGGLQASGVLALRGGGTRDAIPSDIAGLAARLNLEAQAVTLDTAISLPSGVLSVTAGGADGITLLSGAALDVSGRDITFDTRVSGTPGGEIRLLATQGDVRLEGGRMDVSGAPAGGRGGRLRIDAHNGDLRHGDVTIEGRGAAGEDGAAYVVDVRDIRTLDGAGGDALSAWLSMTGPGDFSAAQQLRVRQGDLSLRQGERMVARHVSLTADQGNVTVDGDIDASGVDGGRIELAAGDMLTVTGVLDAGADAVDGAAGHIELVALDADADGRGGLDVGPGARLELNGGGALKLYVPAGANGTLTGLNGFRGVVTGAAAREVMAVRVVKNPGLDVATGDSSLSQATLDVELSALDGFLQTAEGGQPAGFALRAVLDVQAQGRLVLNQDLNPGATGLAPGLLMLRAADDLVFNATLSDGVEQASSFLGTPKTRIRGGESWSYLLGAGADHDAAGFRAVDGPGDVIVNDARVIRTGSGNISVLAGGDIRLGEAAAIYTFGRDAGAGAFADVTFPQFSGLNGDNVLHIFTGGIQFGEGGGDVRIEAGGDLRGAGVAALNQAWQPKVGGDYNAALPGIGELPVIRGISVDDFSNGVGVLGGGRLAVSAGRDISGLSLVMPGTIRPIENIGVVSTPVGTRIEQRADTRFALSGGSSLQVRAGRDISDFYLQADQGRVRLRAGRNIGADVAGQASLLGVGDADVALVAGNSLQVDNVFDPGLVAQATGQFDVLLAFNPNLKGIDTLFLSQSDNARLAMTSLAGDAVYRATTTTVLDRLSLRGPVNSSETDTLIGRNIVPARFALQSMEGSVRVETPRLSSLPAADGYIRMLAGKDIVLDSSLALVQADANLSLLPDRRFPLVLPGDANASDQLVKFLTSGDSLFHALTPIHANSTQFNQLVARNGDIRRSGSESATSSLVFSNQTRLVAGRDILGLNVNIQHASASHISLVSAGRDIRQATLRESTGQLTGNDNRVYTIAGPGQLQFRAGRSIDLGASAGIMSIGDTANTVLPDDGASISVLAGYTGEPDYAAFMERYIDTDDTYLPQLRAFLASIEVDPAGNMDARAALRDIDPLQRNRFLTRVLFSELKASGIQATGGASPTGDYSRGFEAIGILFPTPNPEGRLDIKLSKIFTLDGGDIDLLMPGGLINGGATSNAALTKEADELGVVTGRSGNISAFVDGDFLVNQSRVFALNGDLLMWSSNGDIDAGRGSKTALASPAPETRIDPKTGQTIVEFPPNISGSGLSGVNGFLFAPRGRINAGDAGIQATGNLTLGAVEVIGADNIDVGGLSVGVPVANSGGLAAGLSGVSNVASSATKQAESSTASLASIEDGGESQQLGMISVEILGFGE